MIRTKLQQILNRRDRESGNDIVTLVMVIPIIIILFFTMIDVSYYLQARSMVQSAAQDGARMVALYGGQSGNISLNKSNQPVQNLIMPKIYDSTGDRCIPSACYQPPVVRCTPEVVTEGMGLGTEVSCNIRYFYAPASAGLAQLIGFGELLTSEINVTQTSISETYYLN